METNPYKDSTGYDTTTKIGNAPKSNVVNRILHVAILLIVNGVLMLGGGAVFVGCIFLFWSIPPEEMGSEAIVNMMVFWYAAIGGILILAGLLQFIAGICIYQFRGRWLGIVSMGFGLLTFFSLICLPTSLGLAIYGFIVLLDPTSVEAFRLRSEGVERDVILAKLGRPPIPR